ncbi:hypothetical protein BOX15_Mlig030825g1 [Macrostomum lignano]|uniref:Uncharacterized protein n=1 Tax=Macrostomum lignano TaxID=282301 RepID=A0A267F958_9PLAT|nr:hypothetical protein BOX15_Mlig030825g1 [Macrostomum lignano]
MDLTTPADENLTCRLLAGTAVAVATVDRVTASPALEAMRALLDCSPAGLVAQRLLRPGGLCGAAAAVMSKAASVAPAAAVSDTKPVATGDELSVVDKPPTPTQTPLLTPAPSSLTSLTTGDVGVATVAASSDAGTEESSNCSDDADVETADEDDEATSGDAGCSSDDALEAAGVEAAADSVTLLADAEAETDASASAADQLPALPTELVLALSDDANLPPLDYIFRVLSNRYLLPGNAAGVFHDERAVKVHLKMDAIGCLARLVSWEPALLRRPVLPNSPQRADDVLLLLNHSDAQLVGRTAQLLCSYLAASVAANNISRAEADTEIGRLLALIDPGTPLVAKEVVGALSACLPQLGIRFPALLDRIARALPLALNSSYALLTAELCSLLSGLPFYLLPDDLRPWYLDTGVGLLGHADRQVQSAACQLLVRAAGTLQDPTSPAALSVCQQQQQQHHGGFQMHQRQSRPAQLAASAGLSSVLGCLLAKLYSNSGQAFMAGAASLLHRLTLAYPPVSHPAEWRVAPLAPVTAERWQSFAKAWPTGPGPQQPPELLHYCVQLLSLPLPLQTHSDLLAAVANLVRGAICHGLRPVLDDHPKEAWPALANRTLPDLCSALLHHLLRLLTAFQLAVATVHHSSSSASPAKQQRLGRPGSGVAATAAAASVVHHQTAADSASLSVSSGAKQPDVASGVGVVAGISLGLTASDDRHHHHQHPHHAQHHQHQHYARLQESVRKAYRSYRTSAESVSGAAGDARICQLARSALDCLAALLNGAHRSDLPLDLTKSLLVQLRELLRIRPATSKCIGLVNALMRAIFGLNLAAFHSAPVAAGTPSTPSTLSAMSSVGASTVQQQSSTSSTSGVAASTPTSIRSPSPSPSTGSVTSMSGRGGRYPSLTQSLVLEPLLVAGSSLTNSSTATVSPGEAAATAALSMSLTPPLLRRPAAKQLLQDRFPSLAASYIEPFQLVVVAAMRMYMAPCDQASQSAVLDLFCTLMLLGTNYSSLDRQSTFLTYLLRQLETAATSAPAGPLGRAPLRPLFAFLCSLSQHDPGLLPSARLLQLADSLLAVGWQCQDALGPIIDDLFGRQPAATAAAAATPESHQLLESQREFAANLLLRQPANCLTLLPAPLYLSRRQSEERWLRQSRSVADVLLQQLGTGTLPVDRLDQLRSLDTVLAACSPAALRPTDVPLGLLFLPMLPSTTASAPSIATFGRWLAAVLAGVRLLLAQPEEAVLPRLAGLEVPPPPIQAFVELVATSPSATSPMPRSDEQTLGIQLVSVLAAVLEELANSRQSATVSVASSSEPTANSDDAATATAFVADGGTLLLLYLCHLTAGYRRLGAFCRRSDIVAALNSRVAPLVTTQPRLVIVYCYLLTRWGYFEEDWWLRMLRPSESADDYNVRLCKRGALCVLADWTASDGDGEKFSWLIPNFLADIVNDSRRYEELHRLVSAVHRNRLASEMLVNSASLNWDSFKGSPVSQKLLLACCEGLHLDASGPLIRFLLDKFTFTPPSGPLLAVRRRAESVVISRLNMLEGAGATAAFSVDDAADALRRAQQRRLTGLVAAMKRYLGNRGARSPNSAAPAAPAAGSPTVAVAVACNADPLTSGVNADDEDSASAAAEKDEADSRAWFANWTADWCLSDSGSAAAAVSGVVGARLLWHLDSAALAKVMSDSRFRLHHLESCIRLASSASAAALTSSALRQRRPASATSTDGGQGQLLAACQAALLKRLLKSSDGAGDATAAAASAASTGSTVAGSADGAAEAETSPAVRWCLGACWLALLSARTSDQIVDSQLSDANIAKQLWRLVARLLSDSAAPGARSRARDSVRLALACARRPGLLTCLAADAQLADRLVSAVADLADAARRVDPCLAAADAVAAAAGAADASHPERRRLSRLIGLAASDAASSHGLDDELLLLCVALARLPHYNESLRVPEEAAVQDGVHVELGALKDPRVLQEVVTRCALLGWTSRQQFEETWVSLISVLNPAVGFDEPERLDPEEEVESTQCKLLAVRAISRLLLDTLTDWPGDPVRRQLYHWPRPLAAPRLNCPPDPSDLCQGDIVNLERIGDVLAYNLNQIAVKKLRDRANNSGAGSGASQLDTRSCLQFLMDLFHSWLRSSNLSNQLLAETVKCCVLVSDLLSDLGHLDWLSGHLSELAAQHPHEDSQTWFYIWAGLGKTQALLLSNQLAANQSTPAAAAGSSTAVGDSPPAAEQVALVAQSWTRLEPALRQLGQADCPLMQMGALHAALYLLQCRPAPSQEALAPLVAFLEAEVANLALSSRRSERLALLALSAAFQVAPLYDDVTSALVSATAKLCASPRLNYFVQACCSHGWQRLVEQAAVPQAALQTLIAKVALSPRGPGLCHLTPSLALLVASLAKCPESAALERVDSACRLLAKAADPIEGLLWSRALPPLMLRLFGRQAALNKALNLFLTAPSASLPCAAALLFNTLLADSMSIAAAANASPTSPAAPAGTTVASSVSGGSGCTSSQLMTELVMPSLSALLAKLAKPWPALWATTVVLAALCSDAWLRAAGAALVEAGPAQTAVPVVGPPTKSLFAASARRLARRFSAADDLEGRRGLDSVLRALVELGQQRPEEDEHLQVGQLAAAVMRALAT